MNVLCVGQCVADIVTKPVDGMPANGQAVSVDMLELLSGGCAANTAAVLAKLGADTRLISVLGQDALAEAALADLRAAGVRVDDVIRDPVAKTPAAIVLIQSNGERSFLYREGSNGLLTGQHVSDGLLRSSGIVHVGGGIKMTGLDLGELARRAKSFGCITSLDTDWDIYGNWMRKLEGALPHLDYLMTNEDEAAMLTGRKPPRDAALELQARGAKVVIVKRGERGVLVAVAGDVTEFPGYAVEVVDTTCAGDSFAAGMLFGMSRGLPLEESIRLGNACGALCVTAISHRGIMSWDQVRRFVEGGS